MGYKPLGQIAQVISEAFELISEPLQPTEAGRLGRATDEVVDASAETGEVTTLFVRLDGQPDAVVAYYDPLLVNVYTLGYDAPVRLRRINGKLTVVGGSMTDSTTYFVNGLPSATPKFAADSGSTILVQSNQTLTLAGGTGLSTSSDGTSTITVNLDTPVTLANGGTGANLGSATNGTVRKSGTALTVRLDNLSGATAPGVNDDSSAGYSVGSEWYDTTNNKAYVCVKATAGAAVWIEQGGDPGITGITLNVPSPFTITGSPMAAPGGTFDIGIAGSSAKQVFATAPSGTSPFAGRSITTSYLSDSVVTLQTSQTLLSNSSSIGISGIPSGFKSVGFHFSLRSDNAGATEVAIIRFNPLTAHGALASNYYSVRSQLRHNAIQTTNETLGTVAGILAFGPVGNTAPLGHYGVLTGVIDRYTDMTVGVTTTGGRLRGIGTGALDIVSSSGIFNADGPVDAISVYPQNGTNWLAGSTYIFWLNY